MKLTYLGHASLLISFKNTTIVTDPWFTKKGAYASTWFQFPDNTEIDFSWIKDLDFVCISHEHEDHFDLEFLKKLNPDVKIVTAKFNNKRFLNLLTNNLNNDVIEIDDRKQIMLGDIKFTPMIQVPMGSEDSAMIFKCGDEVIMNFNDMKPSQKDLNWIKDRYKVKYLFKQFSGASWYPIVYDFDEQTKQQLSDEKRLFKYETIHNIINELGVKYYIPFAGPPCFLGKDNFKYNFGDHTTFPNQVDIYEYFLKNYKKDAQKFLVLTPGDEVSCDWKKNLNKEFYVDKKNYLKKYQKKRQDIIKTENDKIKKVNYSLLPKAKKYFTRLMRLSPKICNAIDGGVLFNLTGDFEETIRLDFRKRIVELNQSDNHFYKFDIEGKWFNHVLNQNITWEEFFLTLNFKAYRTPNLYNEHLMSFLKLADGDAYKKYEDYHFDNVESETFELNYLGEKYRCQRYCPHAKGDMSKGKILNGFLTCPTHNWKFSLPDGQCATNKSKLFIEKIDV